MMFLFKLIRTSRSIFIQDFLRSQGKIDILFTNYETRNTLPKMEVVTTEENNPVK